MPFISSDALAAPSHQDSVRSRSASRWALGILVGINLLNYLDRQILYALLPLIQADLGATDAQLGALASAFMLVYMCAAPPVGYWADRSSRKNWIAFGVGFWSLATLASGLAAGYRQLFWARAAVGIGESCYGSVSPSFVAEQYPKSHRARVLGYFSMAIPVGSALGYISGGLIGEAWGWRQAFFLAGIPGLLLAALAFRLRDPSTPAPSGASQRPSAAPLPRGSARSGASKSHPSLGDYSQLSRNSSFVSCTLAMAAMTFGLGAYAVWMPTFFTRNWGMSVSEAGTLFGILTVVSGIAGSLGGGWLADRWMSGSPKAYFIISGAGLLLAFPLSLAALLADRFAIAASAIFLAEICAFLNMGPLNALIVSVTKVPMRSMAFAANIFIIHALGDAMSPTIVGLVSDRWGLRPALLGAAAALAVAGAICLWGSRTVEQDAVNAEAAA
ncbi:MAG: MFS transporter [Elusimicrobia bacterium]|nr:MFS transporter [Elusimicrobiota bacterium]